jgi:class 3 adenylate cyclase/tetratricopeptide (TPR) repeat protein
MPTDTPTILARLKRKGTLASELLPAYQTAEYADAWKAEPALYRAFARKLIKEGHPTRAFDLARAGLTAHKGDHELTYLVALAMARGGNISAAEKYIGALLSAPDVAPAMRIEALSLQGRLHKDRFERTKDPALKADYAARSAATYREAAGLPGADSFPRINAATMSLLAGDGVQSKALARQVIDEERGRLGREPGLADDYWVTGTLGEAYFLLGDLAEAAVWYGKAFGLARDQGSLGDVVSMRRNALLIKDALNVSDELLRLLPVGSVVVFSGHMIDHPQRGSRDGLPARFPPDPQLVREVGAAIKEELGKLNATIGVCSAACGADLLFAEAMLERGAELHVVLPFERADFVGTSVDFGLKGAEWTRWRASCENVLARAELHFATEEQHLGDDVLFDFGGVFSQGLARLRAAQRGVVPQALVVCDPDAAKGRAGTADFVEQWTGYGLPSKTIDLRRIREDILGESAAPPPPVHREAAAPPADHLPREMKAMLFADVKTYSSLTDPSLPRFVTRFLAEAHKVLRELGTKPVMSNTWGDCLYLVFDRVRDCAEASLRLLENFERVQWKEVGLDKEFPLRIGLHTGPVFRCIDPIIDRLNYFGSQVTRAARIEPVTIPGCAFASEQFAALLAVESWDEFVCEYVGVEELHKDYGRCPLYGWAGNETIFLPNHSIMDIIDVMPRMRETSRSHPMSDTSQFPIVPVSVVIVERAGFYLVEFNQKWNTFSLPMSRQRRLMKGGVETRETALEAAVRSAAMAVGQPLDPARFPRPVPLRSPYARIRSRRTSQTKDYHYSVFAMRVVDPLVRHALGWHTIWMRPEDLATHVPVSETVTRLLPHLPEDLYESNP